MEHVYEKINQDPEFHALQKRRSRFSWILAGIMLTTYYAFILVIAFQPSLFAIPLAEGSTVTWGIVAGLGVIAVSFILTGVYVVRANGEFDRETAEVLARVQSH
ncbi:MAG: DUF485 domain-containing protein [Gammaproteobacteria bacterium]